MTVKSEYNWQELAVLRPKLRSHIRVYAQDYRGERWFILNDDSNGRHLRFNTMAYEFIGRMDGEHTPEEICLNMQKKLGEQSINREEITLIITQLLNIDALKSGAHKKSSDILTKFQKDRRLKLQRTIMNPLSIRTPLFDPDRLLNRLMPWVQPLYSYAGAVIWFSIVIYACLLALSNFALLSAAVNPNILAVGNVFYMAVIFVFIKIIHEFSHAFTVKIWGGEVHEMGITLLVLVPIPYVDASASSSFRSKYKRMLVGAAGIISELFIAAIALIVWFIVEPGIVRSLALNTVLIASVSTLLFNANPLLRFDGFYVLQDYLEIPNLYTRSSRYYIYLLHRYLFRLEDVRSPITADGERGWFIAYGLASFIYRIIILVSIVLFLANEYLFIGVALGMWAVAMQIVLPLVKAVRFLQSSPLLENQRKRAVSVTIGLVGSILIVLLFVPVPVTIHTEGVLWVSDQAEMFTETDGFITEVLAPPGSHVEADTPIVRMINPVLTKRIEVLRGQSEELQIRSTAERRQQIVKSQLADEELARVMAELTVLESQASQLIMRAAVAGTFVKKDNLALAGQYLRQGELVGYIVSPEHLIVRTVVPQSTIGLVLNSFSEVDVKFVERLGNTVSAIMQKQSPAGKTRLPSAALGAMGGGNIATVANDETGLTAAEKIFQVDLELPKELDSLAGLGERAFVRFRHESEPLAYQWWRSIRQLLLSRLGE